MKRIMYQSMTYAQKALYAPLLMVVLTAVSFNTAAQTRNYGIIYSDNIRGGATIFGNTLMNVVTNGSVDLTAMNDNAADGNSNYTNGNVDMQYVDIDGSTGDGAGTKNSSSSDLILPSGTNNIKMARLYWGGRTYTASNRENMNLTANRNIKIRKGTSGAYAQFAALQIDRVFQNQGEPTEVAFYQAYVDITSFIQQNGDGTYTVGDATLGKGNGGVFGNYGGWSIVVVYENSSLDYNSVRVYDGYDQVYNGGNIISNGITLTGLDVPSGALSDGDARMGALIWEGDANFKQDFLEINGNRFSNAVNTADNPWNGTISNDGVHITTKNPNYTNQMGVDIDQFNVGNGYGILPNATSVTLTFGTEPDSYFPGIFTFVIKMKDPTVSLTKTVTDASGNGTAEPGEVITYKLTGTNIGGGNATAVTVADTLPANITYVPGSLKVISGPGVPAGTLTDASGDDNGEYVENGSVKSVQLRMGAGSDASVGGILATQESFEVEFQAIVNTPALGESLLPVINIARLQAKSESDISYVDDGIAILNPDGGPLPVTLKSFTASLNGSSVKLNWATSMELNSKKYLVQRSTDGRLFTTVAIIDAAGNSSSEKSYSINDDVTAVTGSVTYYRLNQVDLDGKSSYSKVISVRLKKDLSGFTVSPNPFRSYVNVNIDWSKNELTTVKVFNMTGRELVSKNVQMIKGTNYVALDEVSKLPAGNYILQFNTGTERINKQITKQ